MYLLLLIARLLLAALFLIAGVSKLLNGFGNSRKALADFGVPSWLVVQLSVALPVAELIAVCLLIPATTARIGVVLALGLLLSFNAAIAINLALGRTPSCNCFGQLHSAPIGWRTFARNSLLAALAALVAWEIPRQPTVGLLQLLQGVSARDTVTLAVAFLLFAAVAVETVVLLHTLRQNGRLLLRIETLEANAAVAQPQMPARPVLQGLPVGAKAIPFDLPKVNGGRVTLDSFLDEGKPLLLISTDPKCGPCNVLMPEVSNWQQSLSGELTVVLLSHGRNSDNKAKVAEYALQNMILERDHEIAAKYHAIGTPTAVLIRADGTIGSPAMGGADAIRQLITTKAWTEAGFAAFMHGLGYPPQPPAPKPKVPVGMEAPAFTLPDVDGKAINSANFNGTGTVLLFWNPACGFCQKMLPQLKEWESGKVASAPRLMLVSTGSRDANRAMGLESTVLIDEKFAVGQSYGASGTPSAVLIDGKGKIASGLAVGAPGVFELLNGKVIANIPALPPEDLKSVKAAAK